MKYNRFSDYIIKSTFDDNVTKKVTFYDEWSVLSKVSDNFYIMYQVKNDKLAYKPLYIHSFSFFNNNIDFEKSQLLKKNVDDLNMGEKLKYYRLKKSLRMEDIAKYVGLDRSTYYDYEKGVVKYYPYKMMIKLVDILEIDLEGVLDDYHKFTYYNQGNNLKKIRECLGGLKQYELADLLDINRVLLSGYEKDKVKFPRENYDKLMDIYNECLEKIESVQ